MPASELFDFVDIDALRRRRTAKWSNYGPDVLAAWIAEMDFAIAPPVQAAILDAVDRGSFGYAPSDVSDLTDACAAFFGEAYDWRVEPTRIFLVPDVLDGVGKLLEVVTDPARAVVVPTPAYPPFFEVVGLAGRAVIEVPAVADGGRPVLDLPGIERALAKGAGTVLLCNPHNPLGRVYTRAELAALAAIVVRHGARVIADEVHAPLVYDGHRHVPFASISPEAAAHAATVTSASKAWNVPGLKCAQIVLTNDDDVQRWEALSPFAVGGRSPLGIAASVAAYSAGTPWLRDLVAYLDGNRRLLVDAVALEWPEVGLYAPEAGYLAWLDFRAMGLEEPAKFFLDHALVAVSEGADFGTGAEGFIRLNFATSRHILQEILLAMGGALRNGA